MAPAMNSGPPSDDSSSVMSKVTNTLRSTAIRPLEPSAFSSTISLGGRVVVCCVAATSSDRSGISAWPTEFRDKASATVLRTPGMCSTRNRYRSDFSLMFRNRGLVISSRARSPAPSIVVYGLPLQSGLDIPM